MRAGGTACKLNALYIGGAGVSAAGRAMPQSSRSSRGRQLFRCLMLAALIMLALANGTPLAAQEKADIPSLATAGPPQAIELHLWTNAGAHVARALENDVEPDLKLSEPFFRLFDVAQEVLSHQTIVEIAARLNLRVRLAEDSKSRSQAQNRLGIDFYLAEHKDYAKGSDFTREMRHKLDMRRPFDQWTSPWMWRGRIGKMGEEPLTSSCIILYGPFSFLEDLAYNINSARSQTSKLAAPRVYPGFVRGYQLFTAHGPASLWWWLRNVSSNPSGITASCVRSVEPLYKRRLLKMLGACLEPVLTPNLRGDDPESIAIQETLGPSWLNSRGELGEAIWMSRLSLLNAQMLTTSSFSYTAPSFSKEELAIVSARCL